MKNEFKLPENYRNLTVDEIEVLEGGVGYSELLSWLINYLGRKIAEELVKAAVQKTYSALLAATKRLQNPAYQAWARELNRHQYCCAGNGIGKGCPGRG